MFYDSNDFKALEAGSRLAWMQQELSLQNIANVETPGYKAKRLQFSSVLDAAQGAGAQPKTITASVVEDDAVSNRTDGNNVDQEAESLALYQDYAQYSTLLNRIKSCFNQYDYVLNCGIK